MQPRYSPEIRRTLDAVLVKRSVITSATMGALLLASEWGHHFGATLAVFVVWQVTSAIGGALLGGQTQRRMPNVVFFIINTSFCLAFGVVTGWSVPSLMLVPYVIATYEAFGDGDTRGFVVAKLVIFFAAMAMAGVAPASMAATVLLGWIVHWLSDGRSHTLRAALAELERSNVSLAEEMRARLQAEAELRQAQRLESVGRLAAGVAHEINTPVQYVADSLRFIADGTDALVSLLQVYRAHVSPTKELEAVEADADLEYLLEETPGALARATEGLQRIGTIVRSMKEFAHPDQEEMQPADLNRGITSTLVVATSEYRLVADVETDLAPLPPVICHSGAINQIVLNIVVNAAHAIKTRVGSSGERGLITVRTRTEGPNVVIAISDTGSGVPEHIKEHIFDLFFTTKGVGEGSGQGLAIARAVAVKHGGSITFESEAGRGTTFFVRLPIGPVPAVLAKAAA